MATLLNVNDVPAATIGDEIFLADYTRVKKINGMWIKDLTADGALVVGKISKEEIQSLGFVLQHEILTIDDYAEMGLVVEDIDYGYLNAPLLTETDINYGNLNVGSGFDLDYGSLD